MSYMVTGYDPQGRSAYYRRNLSLSAAIVAHCAGPVRRSRALKMTGAQRNSEGRRSEWSASPYYFTDPKWGATCSTV